jgi:hypothetical protein
MPARVTAFFIVLLFMFLDTAEADEFLNKKKLEAFAVWEGTDSIMTVKDLVAYCAPVFWFSPDEPELDKRKGKDINIPTYFPFDTKTDSPVVYFQINEILTRSDSYRNALKRDYTNFLNSELELKKINGVNISYSHFYNNEAGLGSHQYDTEQAQFQYYVYQHKDKLGIMHFAIIFVRATGKAHALDWYDNIYDIDDLFIEQALPFNILVEEGKHASCTDMNGDGYYTPGYDVNVRKNDAWGVRDIMRSGDLFSSDYQSYMSKVRKPEHRVFPPMPEGSKLWKRHLVNGKYALDNAVYQLRQMPSPVKARNKILKHDMESYYQEKSPTIKHQSSKDELVDWFIGDNFINSVGVSYRLDDGQSGVSVSLPLLIVKNVEAPLIGGWLVNRLYFQGSDLRDFGYNLLYTPSASRFSDLYFASGLEFTEKDSSKVETVFVLEAGIKFRGNVSYSPLKFLSFLSPFWGLRLGIKNKGFMRVDKISYVLELGAGVW